MGTWIMYSKEPEVGCLSHGALHHLWSDDVSQRARLRLVCGCRPGRRVTRSVFIQASLAGNDGLPVHIFMKCGLDPLASIGESRQSANNNPGVIAVP